MLKKRKRQLVAIMFTDIIGYSAMMNTNEQDGITKANRYRQVLTEQVEKHGGEIIQHYGDGSLSIFSSSVEAVTCAKQIQIDLKEIPQVPLRVGLHLGDIVLEGEEIYGDGVNIASRVESMGIAGAILMTERIVHDLKSHPDFILASLGAFQFKNIAKPLEVFALANKGFPIPDKNNISGKLEASSAPIPHYLWLPVIGIITLLGGWGLWNHFSDIPKVTPSEKKDKISIAVLPFENLTLSSEGTTVSNGVMQEIISKISAIHDFRVLSKTSMRQYANSQLSIPLIANEVGASYILEGGVQFQNNRIRINTTLIHASEDVILWSENHEGNFDEILDFQVEIANKISNSLGVILSPLESTIVNQKPTKNMLAYQKYLDGLEGLELYGNNRKIENRDLAKNSFQQAITQDSNFAEVYVELGKIYALESKYDSSFAYFDKALSMNDKLAEAYLQKGNIQQFTGKSGGFENMLKAYELNPNSAETNGFLAYGYIRKTQFDRAYHYAMQAKLLSPNNQTSHIYLIMTLYRLGFVNETFKTLEEAEHIFGKEVMKLTRANIEGILKDNNNLRIEIFEKRLSNGQIDLSSVNDLQIIGFLGQHYAKKNDWETSREYFEYFIPQSINYVGQDFPREHFRVRYAYTLKQLGEEEKADVIIEKVLSRDVIGLQKDNPLYERNFNGLAFAHAYVSNVDSCVYWVNEYKKNGNYVLKAFANDYLLEPIILEPTFQKFINQEQAKIDSMAANVRQMMVKG